MRGVPTRFRRAALGAVLLAIAVTAVTVIGPVPAGAAPITSGGEARPRTFTWSACGGVLECAVLDVPVDYAVERQDATFVGIRVVRAPATDPDRRIGSLIVNFGGPGDPGTETLPFALDAIPAEIRERFDIVSFDPRGTGDSRPIDCVDDETFEQAWSEDPTPDSPDELPGFYDGTASSVDIAAACISAQGEWLAQVGTRNVARDLESLRRALDERRLNFLGYSYGTVLGAVYAQLYPQRIRTMVLDSAVDLSVDAPTEQRANVEGFERALDAFLADCADRPDCAFHSGGNPRAALTRLRDRFEAGETADVELNIGRDAGVAEFYTALLASLYSRDSWSLLATALDDARDGDGTYLRLITDSYTGKRDDGTYNNFQEAIGIISCDDRPDVQPSFEDYQATHEQLSAAFPFFGPLLTASPTGCDPRLPRPRPGEELGDVRVADAPPILIIGTTNDPATPYAGALDLRSRIAGSRLLTFDSTEHGSYAKGIACIDDAVDAYLLRRTLPARGLRCDGARAAG